MELIRMKKSLSVKKALQLSGIRHLLTHNKSRPWAANKKYVPPSAKIQLIFGRSKKERARLSGKSSRESDSV